MKRALFLLLVLCTLAVGQTVQDYSGQSAAQLSAMTDYVTIPNTAYWNTHAYKQIELLLNWVVPRDMYTAFYGAVDTAYYALEDTTTDPAYPYIRGMVDIDAPNYVFIPPSVTLAANRNYSHNGNTHPLIDITGTHDVIITGGGTLYGKSDSAIYNNAQTEHDAAIQIASSKRVLVDGMNISHTAGDGVFIGYVTYPTLNEVDTSYYKVESTGITVRNSHIYVPTVEQWNHPVHEQIGRNGISVVGGRDVVIDGCYISGGVPAAIDVEGNTAVVDTVDNLIITNCVIDGLSKGRYTVGKVVSNTSFYLKSVNNGNLNLAGDSLAGFSIASTSFGNIASGYGATNDDWKVITSNTATSGGYTTITFSAAFDDDPTNYYAVIYNHNADWPALPDTADLFGDGLITSANLTAPYSITVTGITATLNQLATYRVYFTSNPAYGIKRHIESNDASVADSVLVTLNASFRDMTPVQGTVVGLGDAYGAGIMITGASRYRNIIVANNIIKNTYSYGIRFQGSALDTTHKIIIANNRFENCWDVAIETAGSREADIHGNSIYNATLGINIMGDGYNTVTGNTVRSCPRGGIWVLGSAGNDSTGTTTHNAVFANVVTECGRGKDAYPAASIRLDWSKKSACYGNTIINTDTSTNIYQRAITFNYCKELNAGHNHVAGYLGKEWWGTGCTYQNTTFSLSRRSFGVNSVSEAYAFTVADSVGATNYTAISGGVIYPNAANASNKIAITGAHLFVQGGTISSLSVTDSSSVRKDVVVASIDSTDALSTSIRGSVNMPNIVQSATYNATAAGEFWVNASHDTMWYSVDGTNAAFILIDGYVVKH